MELGEFRIGGEFFMGDLQYRCTDVGQRTVTALQIEPGRDPSWYNGPPYAVVEHSLDEYDLPACRNSQ